MWPLILLGLGAGYYFYKKSSTTSTSSAYHPAVLSIPAAGTPQNAAVYAPTSPIVQTPSGPSSGIPQYPSPISHAPSAPINFSAVPIMHAAITAPVAPGATIGPMPGVINKNGVLITWAPYSAGSITNDPSSGNWLGSNQPDTISLVVTTPQGSITLPRTMIYNIDTGEIRI